MKVTLPILICLLLCGCNNSSTTFAWRSIIQDPAIEAKGAVGFTPAMNDQTVNAEKQTDISTDVKAAKDITEQKTEETKPAVEQQK